MIFKSKSLGLAFASAILVGNALGIAAPNALGNVGLFTTAHFVHPSEWSLGIEPVVTFTTRAGVGANARFTYGLNELNNITAILGTGSDPRQFRVGANYTFDFFPDVEGQPGIGLAAQGLFFQVSNSGQLDLQLAPYIHKTFYSGKSEIEPFLGLPFGLSLLDGNYRFTMAAALGAMFKPFDHFRFAMELGIGLANADTYVSGGASYYY